MSPPQPGTVPLSSLPSDGSLPVPEPQLAVPGFFLHQRRGETTIGRGGQGLSGVMPRGSLQPKDARNTLRACRRGRTGLVHLRRWRGSLARCESQHAGIRLLPRRGDKRHNSGPPHSLSQLTRQVWAEYRSRYTSGSDVRRRRVRQATRVSRYARRTRACGFGVRDPNADPWLVGGVPFSGTIDSRLVKGRPAAFFRLLSPRVQACSSVGFKTPVYRPAGGRFLR